jgi:hypothetical protein
MSKFSKPLLATAIAVGLLSANAFAADTNNDNLYLQTGQRNTSALNQFDGAAVQADTQQAISSMQQDVSQQAEQNKNYIQQVQQQIIQTSANSATVQTTTAPAPSTTATPSTNTVTTPSKPDNNAAAQTTTPNSTSAPATPTGIDSGSTPSDGGGSWNYGF